MNILFLDGSPKAQNSASVHFLKGLEPLLTQATVFWHNARNETPEAMAMAMEKSDALVIAFPLYVDGIPSHLLYMLEAIEPLFKHSGASIPVYALCNAGFYEASQTRLAFQMLQNWCEKSGLTWGTGVGIGGGGMAMAAPVGQGPFAKLGVEFKNLALLIQSGASAQSAFTQPSFPRFLYISMAHMGWRSQARKNGVGGAKMKKQHIYKPAP